MAPKMKENEDPMFGNVSRQLLLSRKVKASRPAKMDFLRKNVQKPQKFRQGKCAHTRVTLTRSPISVNLVTRASRVTSSDMMSTSSCNRKH